MYCSDDCKPLKAHHTAAIHRCLSGKFSLQVSLLPSGHELRTQRCFPLKGEAFEVLNAFQVSV